MTQTRRAIEERFYDTLLPALLRARDHAQGEPLRALLAILEHELLAVRDDTQGLYDDWFIETCREWVVPYVGDLLGVELQRSLRAEGFTQRAYVANTLRYRRRKGTASVLEQLCRDVTGWPTRAVEYFQRLTSTQHMQHPRLGAPVTTSLRGAAALEGATGPFGRSCHSPELRSITRARGRFAIPNVGLHVWRLRPYPLDRVEARPVVDPAETVPAGRYHFDVLGRRAALFNDPRAETEIVHLAEARDVPARLRRRALHAELQPLVAGEVAEPPADGWFGRQPVLRVIRVDGGVETELRPPALRICNLAVEGDAHPADADGDPSRDWPRPQPGQVLVDPQCGRLALPPPALEAPPEALLVDWVYGFSADLGGGPYDRRATVPERIDATTSAGGGFQHGVSKDEVAVADEVIHADLAAAIDAWNRDALAAWVAGHGLERVITIMDSRSYAADLTRAAGRCIVMTPNSHLRLVAARWPAQTQGIEGAGAGAGSAPSSERRVAGRLDPMGLRPHLIGDVEVLGLADPELAGGHLEIDGLLIEGALRVLPGALGRLALRHSTLVPGHGGLIVESTAALPSTPAPAPFADRPLGALASNADLELELTRAIVDGLSFTGPASALAITDSIVDRGGAQLRVAGHVVDTLAHAPLATVLAAAPADVTAILAALATVPDVAMSWTHASAREPAAIVGPEVDGSIRTSTLLGAVELRALEGSESLFAGPLAVQVTQTGCLRYCYAPVDSRSPRRFRCQPDLALTAAATAARDAGEPLDDAALAALRGPLRPLFTSTTHGHPAYCQLTRSTPAAISTGAEDGSEMGAFHMLEQAHRESNLRAALDKYLRFGLDAGVFYMT